MIRQKTALPGIEPPRGAGWPNPNFDTCIGAAGTDQAYLCERTSWKGRS